MTKYTNSSSMSPSKHGSNGLTTVYADELNEESSFRDEKHPLVCQDSQEEAGRWAEKEERLVKLVVFPHSGQGEHYCLSVSFIYLRKERTHIQHFRELQNGALQGWMVQDLTLGDWRV